MTPERLAKIVTPAVIVALLAFVITRKNGFEWRAKWTSVQTAAVSSATPQDAINAMQEAARVGDSRAYLDLYAGPMRMALDQTLAEKGDAGFRDYLKASSAELKGFAVFDPKPSTDSEVQVRVEYVYQDRNEAQLLTLGKSGTGWKIVRSENAATVKTIVPYGTPVQ